MTLACGTDDHDVVCTVICGHAHTANIVFKSAGSDLGSDNRAGLRVYISKVVGGGKGNAPFKGFGAVMVFKRSHVQVFCRFTPGPAPAARAIVFKILEDLCDINGLIGRKLIIAHYSLPPLKRFSASVQSLPSTRAIPASRMGRF